MAIDKNYIFPRGKHAGKSIALVEKIEPSYISWVQENAPNLLKFKAPTETTSKERKIPPEDSEVIKSSLQPNLDFLTQKTDFDYGKADD